MSRVKPTFALKALLAGPVLATRVLLPADDKSKFKSGHLALDLFLTKRSSGFITYVTEQDGQIIGYVSMVVGLHGSDAALSLARLATDERHRGKGVGGSLLAQVIKIAARTPNIAGVIVDSKTETVPFYARYGFEIVLPPLPDPILVPMFLDMETIKEASLP